MRSYILIAFFTLFSCKNESVDNTSSIAISTIADITDPFDLGPDANAILSLYRFPENENQEAYFRFLSITDKGLNPCLEYQIEDGKKSQLAHYGLDYQLRKKLIIGFYDSIRQWLSSFQYDHTRDTSLSHSECFQTIAAEINLISRRKVDKAIIVAFTDLQENSKIFNCYNPPKTDPDAIADLLITAYPLPLDLRRFKIYIVYNPTTRDEDMRFCHMIMVYRKILEPRGANVIVQAQNDHYEYE